MALTYAQLSSLVQTYLQNFNADLIAAMPDIVRQAEDRIYKAVQIPALKKNQAGNTTGGNRFLTLPTDFLATYSISVTAAGETTYLLEREVSWISEATGGIVNSSPRFYALFDDHTYLLGPTPSSAFPVELHYYYRPPSIVDTSTSWLGTNAEGALLYATLVEGYTYLKGEADVMGMYQNRLTENINMLKNLGEGRNKTDMFKIDAPKTPPT